MLVSQEKRSIASLLHTIETVLNGARPVLSEEAGYTLHDDDLELEMWDQTWSSTSCGFGGISGQAFTTSTVMVVTSPLPRTVVVFIAGRYAYTIKKPSQTFHKHRKERILYGVSDERRKSYEDPKESGDLPLIWDK